jgi:hypothetical protein
VDESNSTGAEILLRRMVPVEYFTWPFRRGIGADASGRRVRLVNALPIEARNSSKLVVNRIGKAKNNLMLPPKNKLRPAILHRGRKKVRSQPQPEGAANRSPLSASQL